MNISALKQIHTDSNKVISYRRGVRESARVKIFDPNKYQVVHETPTHLQFNCPFCLERRGKIDNDGKLYFSKEKKVSFCFKCETVGVLETNQDISELDLEFALTRFKAGFKSEPVNHPYSEIEYDKMFDSIDEEGVDYLSSRTPVYCSFIDKIRFRVSPKYGIAVPVRYWGHDISYNLRLYNPTGRMKYFIPNGVKYLYSPNNIFCPDGSFQEVTLVEGYFDAIGALLDGHKNPIAIFGKSMTPLQKEMLRSISPSKISLYLDEAKLSWKLYWTLKKEFPSVRKIEIVPTNNDPEERFIYTLNREPVEKLLKQFETIYKEEFYDY